MDGNEAANSITNSYATGAVTAGEFSFAGGLVGYNFIGTITQSDASGAVTVGANSIAGGLVGENFTGASITNSYATGAISSVGVNVQLGGLVGENDPGATIVNSQAYGNVTSTANLPPQNINNNCFNVDCHYINVGGFVGANFGTISGTAWTNAPANCAAASTCAAGNVSVGALGSGGGFAGYNEGIITYAFATGNVTGAAGLARHDRGRRVQQHHADRRLRRRQPRPDRPRVRHRRRRHRRHDVAFRRAASPATTRARSTPRSRPAR